MRISILGAGHAGTAVAADLSLRGHEVNLIKTSHAMHNKNFNYILNNDGAVRLVEKGKTQLAKINHVTRDLSRLSESEIVMVTDLPQPDSPTTPTILPAGMLKLTPLTALVTPTSVKK